MKKTVSLAFAATMSVLVTACGGGSGSENLGSAQVDETIPTSNPQPVSLARFTDATEGTIYSTRLRGSDSAGTEFDGTLSLANRAQITLEGVLVTPRDMIMSIDANGTSFTMTATSYEDGYGNLIQIDSQTTGVSCAPVTPDRLPDSVKVGDFGILSPMICSDGTTQTRNWRVEEAGGDAISLVTNTVTKDQYGETLSTADASYVIQRDGNLAGFTLSILETDTGYSLHLESI